MANLRSVQAGLAVLALAVLGGAALLLAGLLWARRRPAVGGGARALLRDVPDALGDAAFLLDGTGRVVAASAVAELRFPPGALRGRRIEELLGEAAALLRHGLAHGPATGRLQFAGAGPAQTVLVRVSARPVRELVVMRFEQPLRPPPLPAALVGPPARVRARARADLAALGAALRGPIQQAATAAGLLRLALPGGAASRELQRLESALDEAERRIRSVQGGAQVARELAAVDLAALVDGVLGGVPSWRARLRIQLAPAHARVDATRLRSAVREVLRAAAESSPAGAEVNVRVGVRSGAAVIELGPALAGAAVGEAAALARALLATEGGEVELEAVPGRGGLCRISLPVAAAEG